MERSAARGMLSCRPAQAACRSESAPRGSRASSAPARRRKARICARVRSSRAPVALHLRGAGRGVVVGARNGVALILPVEEPPHLAADALARLLPERGQRRVGVLALLELGAEG